MAGKADSKVKIYKFDIQQLEDSHLEWLAKQCREQINEAPQFFGTIGTAMMDEKDRRAMRPDDPGTELSVPWLVDTKDQYLNACRFTAFAMQGATEQADWTLRNFFHVVQEILYDQVDQGIVDAVTGGADLGAHCH